MCGTQGGESLQNWLMHSLVPWGLGQRLPLAFGSKGFSKQELPLTCTPGLVPSSGSLGHCFAEGAGFSLSHVHPLPIFRSPAPGT